MKKFLLVFLFFVSALSIQAQETAKYAIISLEVNPYHKNFDCKTGQQVRLISTPILVPSENQVVKWNLTYQFINWIYENDRQKLDLIASYTNLSYQKVLYASTKEEVIKKVKSYGYYSTKCNCGPNKNIVIYEFKDIKYKDEQMKMERQKLLREYVEKK